mmetsp:Transcript_22892/g.63562  ORF Transcript_22892/g.63562 Transcript_22892/m.63562 type:complete len:397 (+) Transcript_22892:83-1273(+)
MFARALSFLCIASAMTNAAAFVSPANPAASTMTRDPSLNLLNIFGAAKTAVKVKKMADFIGKDKDGNVIRVPVKNVERNWNFDGYEAQGEFSADLFIPEDGKIKGCAFFMHGFSQYPVAYYTMLKEACETAGVAVIAVETGLTSDTVLKESMKARFDKVSPQLVLQRAVSEDTKQLIEMVRSGDQAFAEYGVTKSAVGNRIAVMGHSMGGGLSFPVAADCDIDYVFTMAPAFGEEAFDPIIEGVEKRTPKESMLLSGGWDLIAPAKKVKKISEAANSKKKDSSVLVNIKRGLHTGFEDELTLFSVPISSLLKGAGLAGSIFGIADVAFLKVLQVLGELRKRTGQIDGSSILMSYFLSEMVAGKNITPEKAEQYLDDNIKDRFEEKFEFTYGGADGI